MRTRPVPTPGLRRAKKQERGGGVGVLFCIKAATDSLCINEQKY